MQLILFILAALLVPPFILMMFCVLSLAWNELAERVYQREDYRNTNSFRIVNHLISIYSGIGTGFFCAVILSTSGFFEENSLIGFFITCLVLFVYGFLFIKHSLKDNDLTLRTFSLSILPIATFISISISANIFKIVGVAYLWIIIWWEISPNSPWYGY